MANENVIKRKAVSIELRDGKVYNILPLPIDNLIDIWPLVVKLEASQSNVSVELLNDIKKIAYVALKASGNEVQESEIGKLIDISDLQEIIKVIVAQKKD